MVRSAHSFSLIKKVAFTVAEMNALPLVDVRRKALRGEHEGLCYYEEGRIDIFMRGAWLEGWTPRENMKLTLHTVAHELAHLPAATETAYAGHGLKFRRLCFHLTKQVYHVYESLT